MADQIETAGPPEVTDPALGFLLDPDQTYEIFCPDCMEIGSVSGRYVFQVGADLSDPEIDHDPALSDLLDLAGAHKCSWLTEIEASDAS